MDYVHIKHLPRSGITGDNNKFLTQSLFLETCPKGKESEVRWCLSETEQYCPVTDRMVPSAWMCFIYADNEYDAMRKIVGNIKQWDLLKSLKWFADHYNLWTAEQNMMQDAMVKTALINTVREGGNGSTGAAKLLMEKFGEKVKPVGRPKKEKKEAEATDDFDRDFARIASIDSKK